ncbi:hypothetical protein FKM82_019672 [Ascaphus truei]
MSLPHAALPLPGLRWSLSQHPEPSVTAVAWDLCRTAAFRSISFPTRCRHHRSRLGSASDRHYASEQCVRESRVPRGFATGRKGRLRRKA